MSKDNGLLHMTDALLEQFDRIKEIDPNDSVKLENVAKQSKAMVDISDQVIKQHRLILDVLQMHKDATTDTEVYATEKLLGNG